MFDFCSSLFPVLPPGIVSGLFFFYTSSQLSLGRKRETPHNLSPTCHSYAARRVADAHACFLSFCYHLCSNVQKDFSHMRAAMLGGTLRDQRRRFCPSSGFFACLLACLQQTRRENKACLSASLWAFLLRDCAAALAWVKCISKISERRLRLFSSPQDRVA